MTIGDDDALRGISPSAILEMNNWPGRFHIFPSVTVYHYAAYNLQQKVSTDNFRSVLIAPFKSSSKNKSFVAQRGVVM